MKFETCVIFSRKITLSSKDSVVLSPILSRLKSIKGRLGRHLWKVIQDI